MEASKQKIMSDADLRQWDLRSARIMGDLLSKDTGLTVVMKGASPKQDGRPT